MIEGFRLKITSAELKKHCTERGAYHRDRALEYQKEMPKIRESIEALQSHGLATSVARMSKGSFETDPIEDMENKIRDHGNKALVFQFFADHLFDEDYNLKEEDLIRLEVLKR